MITTSTMTAGTKLQSCPPVITVTVGNGPDAKEFYCHSLVLSLASNYFGNPTWKRIDFPDKDPVPWNTFYSCIDPATGVALQELMFWICFRGLAISICGNIFCSATLPCSPVCLQSWSIILGCSTPHAFASPNKLDLRRAIIVPIRVCATSYVMMHSDNCVDEVHRQVLLDFAWPLSPFVIGMNLVGHSQQDSKNFVIVRTTISTSKRRLTFR